MFSRKFGGMLLRLRDPVALDRALARRRQLDRRADRVVGLRRDPHASSPSTRILISHTSRKPSRPRIGRDIGPACVTSTGVPRATASSQRAATSARYAPRPRASGSVEPPNSVAPRSPNAADARATGSPVGVREVDHVVRVRLVAARRSAARRRTRSRRSAPPRRTRRPSPRAAPRHRPAQPPGRSLSTIPIASEVGSSSTRPSSCRRSTRPAGRACVPDLPAALRAAPLAEMSVDLRPHVVELVGLEPEPLGDVPARLLARPHPQDVPVGDDPLVLRPERRVGVRVLGQLEPGIAAHGRNASDIRLAGCAAPPAARRTRKASASAGSAAPLSPTPEPPREVRKVVTVVFCDLTGSTALGDGTDPEALRATMRGYYDEMRTILERHGGTVEKFIGDAVMAVFGVPVAHEDDALRAVRAAWEMRAAVPALGLQARIGVNTGEVVAGEGDALVTGDAVNVAARLEQAADAGRGADRRTRRSGSCATPSRSSPCGSTRRARPSRSRRSACVDVDLEAAAIARRLDTPLVGRARRARAAAAGVRAHRARAALPPLHRARRRRRRQVAARRRVPRPASTRTSSPGAASTTARGSRSGRSSRS